MKTPEELGFDVHSEEFLECFMHDPLFCSGIHNGMSLVDMVMMFSKRHLEDNEEIYKLCHNQSPRSFYVQVMEERER